MNENLIFISYRRADSSPYSLALKIELERKLKDANVFLDTQSIRVGVQWPEYIQNALEASSVLIIVVGPLWFGIDDGTRRIDDPEDWVRREVEYALLRKSGYILPVLLNKSVSLKKSNLPRAISALADIQSDYLRTETWDRDIESILTKICLQYSFSQRSRSYRYPSPDPQKARTSPVAWLRLRNEVKQYMPEWSIEFSDDPSLVNHKTIELTRSFKFSDFEAAMNFMNVVAKYSSQVDHHPRWMNLWKTVTVWLSTWDAGRCVTELDIQFAKVIDKFYKEVKQTRHN